MITMDRRPFFCLSRDDRITPTMRICQFIDLREVRWIVIELVHSVSLTVYIKAQISACPEDKWKTRVCDYLCSYLLIYFYATPQNTEKLQLLRGQHDNQRNVPRHIVGSAEEKEEQPDSLLAPDDD